MTAHLKIKSHAAFAGLQYLLASTFSAYSLLSCLRPGSRQRPVTFPKGPEPSTAASVFLL